MPSVEVSDKTFSELHDFMKKLQNYLRKYEVQVDEDLAISEALAHAELFYDNDEDREKYLSSFEEDLDKDRYEYIKNMDAKERRKLISASRRKSAKTGK